jgi:hypothetical protein
MVNFSNFHRLDPAAREVAIELLANADHDKASSFISFTYRWMAFNGWMSAVTLEYTDRAMINALVESARLVDAHDNLIAAAGEYAELLKDFAAMWPVFNVRDVRAKLGYDAFRELDRAALLATDVKRQPYGWKPGETPTWEQNLRTIYQVRCNLFHGEKSPQSMRDRKLVAASNGILRAFIGETGCFNWYDL